jgi:hypothetical protein
MGKAYHKHSGGSDAFIDYYASEPHYGTPTATIHVQSIDGKTSGDAIGALFAAAPDLLAACKALVDHYAKVNLTGVPAVWPLFNAARAAIVRAEGK